MRYLLRRLGFYLFTAWAAVTITFFIPRVTPGDPVDSLIAANQGQIDTKAIHSLTVLFGLDKHQSLLSQYWDYWVQLAHGDLGISFSSFPTPVTQILRQSLPWTIALVGITTCAGFALGTALGALAGWRRGSCSQTGASASGPASSQLGPSETMARRPPQTWLRMRR